MTYWERSKIFMGLIDWIMIGLMLLAAVICWFQLIAGCGVAGLGVITFPIIALLIWWCNVAPYRPKGTGPHD